MLEKMNNDLTLTGMTESQEVLTATGVDSSQNQKNLWVLVDRFKESQIRQKEAMETQKDFNVKNNF